MKVLYAVSLFSGLKSSIENGRWQPSGAPTIYRMIEALDGSDGDTVFAFSAKDALSSRLFTKITRVQIDGLRSPVWVLPYFTAVSSSGRAPLGKIGFDRLYRESAHALFLWKLHKRHGFDLAYFNNGNLLIAALFARMRVCPTVLRIMGAYPVMKKLAAHARTISERFERYAYRAPYSLAINTQDGSGGEWFMEQALRSSVERTTLMNGVDWNSSGVNVGRLRQSAGLQRNLPIILFVGKMESAKGCDEFLEAVLWLASERPCSFYAIMIGRGPGYERLDRRLRESRHAEYVRLIPSVPHTDIHSWHQTADIYVSLNKLGSLSNANLEAMRHGKSLVILESDHANHVDIVTDRLLPTDAVLRIGRNNIVENLKGALESLLDDEEERRRRSLKILKLAQRLIPSWEERIDHELLLLNSIVNREGKRSRRMRPSGRS